MLIMYISKCSHFLLGVLDGSIDTEAAEGTQAKTSRSSNERVSYGAGSSGGSKDGTPLGEGKIAQVPFKWEMYHGDSTTSPPWDKMYEDMGEYLALNLDCPRVVICTSPPWGVKMGPHDVALERAQVWRKKRGVGILGIERNIHFRLNKIAAILMSRIYIFDSSKLQQF